MDNTWTQPQPAPQLEQEYSSHMFYPVQATTADPNQRYGQSRIRQQTVNGPAPSHVTNFTNPGFASQSTFNFPPLQNEIVGVPQNQFDSNTFYQQTSSNPPIQGQRPFLTQSSQYGSSQGSDQSPFQTSPQGPSYTQIPDATILHGNNSGGFVPSVPSNVALRQGFAPNHVDPNMVPQLPPQNLGYFPDQGPSKRAREELAQQEEANEREAETGGEPPRRPLGACARCKGLKVRCEFKTDPDTCKRCLNANAECIIPGRKKRRAPPKREVLLKQIQAQGDQIKSLMTMLDQLQANKDNMTCHPSSAPSPATTATDLNSNLSSDFTSPDSESSPSIEQVAKPDVLDWIQKARASLEQFGGYISATTDLFSSDIGEGSLDGEDEIAIDIENADDDETGTLMDDGDVDYDLSGDEGSTAGGQRRHNRATSGDVSKRGVENITTPAAPFGLMTELASKMPRQRRTSKGVSDIADDERVDNDNFQFFVPAATPNRPLVDDDHEPPHILTKGIVTPKEVENLFKIYWDHMNISLNVLDPALYTPEKTFWRSPFLFTVICAVAARFYTERPELYQRTMHFARLAAGTALIGGRKSVEMVQAYLILAMNPAPCGRWEDDRSWVFLGLAIRVATAINLHLPLTKKPKDEHHAREMLNRTRTWLACYNLDRSFGSQYGKPPIINNTDYIANHCNTWWNDSPYNIPNFDIHIACYSDELRVMADFGLKIRSDRNNPTGFNKSLDIPRLAAETDDELIRLWESWSRLLEQHTDLTERKCNFRRGLLRLAFTYARLSALSLGFQFGRQSHEDGVMLWRCLRVAIEVAKTYVDDIGIPEQRIYLRHGPDSQSVFVTFACTFLIKLLQAKYAPHLTLQERAEIRELVRRVADLLGSPEVAVDDRHYPKLYSRFLKGLLDLPMAKVDPPIDTKVLHGKAQSASPTVHNAELRKASVSTVGSLPRSAPNSNHPSPSPPPAPQAMMDPFSQQLAAGLDPYSIYQGGPGYSVPEYFNPPLPFEPEMIQSMQSLTDPAVYPDVITGFSWMGDMHQNDHDMNFYYSNVSS